MCITPLQPPKTYSSQTNQCIRSSTHQASMHSYLNIYIYIYPYVFYLYLEAHTSCCHHYCFDWNLSGRVVYKHNHNVSNRLEL